MKGRLARRARVDWPERIASLEQRAASGDTSAMTDMGHTLFEGIQDRAGRDLVRKRAATMGDGDAAVDVGYCFLYGIGTRKNATTAIRQLKCAIASANISPAGVKLRCITLLLRTLTRAGTASERTTGIHPGPLPGMDGSGMPHFRRDGNSQPPRQPQSIADIQRKERHIRRSREQLQRLDDVEARIESSG